MEGKSEARKKSSFCKCLSRLSLFVSTLAIVMTASVELFSMLSRSTVIVPLNSAKLPGTGVKK